MCTFSILVTVTVASSSVFIVLVNSICKFCASLVVLSRDTYWRMLALGLQGMLTVKGNLVLHDVQSFRMSSHPCVSEWWQWRGNGSEKWAVSPCSGEKSLWFEVKAGPKITTQSYTSSATGYTGGEDDHFFPVLLFTSIMVFILGECHPAGEDLGFDSGQEDERPRSSQGTVPWRP